MDRFKNMLMFGAGLWILYSLRNRRLIRDEQEDQRSQSEVNQRLAPDGLEYSVAPANDSYTRAPASTAYTGRTLSDMVSEE